MPSADAIAFSEMDRLPPEAVDSTANGEAGYAEEPHTGEHGALHEELVQVPLMLRGSHTLALHPTIATTITLSCSHS